MIQRMVLLNPALMLLFYIILHFWLVRLNHTDIIKAFS